MEMAKKSVLIFLILFCWGTACQKRDDIQIIKENLESLVHMAERKNLEKIIGQMSPDYLDFEGRNISQTIELIDFYFRHYSGIVIHLLDVSVLLTGNEAQAKTEVLLSSGPLETLRRVAGFVGSFYRFDFRLKKIGQNWKITYSKWEEIEANSLRPSSRAILKKLFPDFLN